MLFLNYKLNYPITPLFMFISMDVSQNKYEILKMQQKKMNNNAER